MAAIAKVDRIDILEASERHGVIYRLVRRMRVIDLDTSTDYTVLMAALATVGVPAPGTRLTGAPNLVLTERTMKLQDDRIVDIDCIYDHGLNEGQSIDLPPFGLLLGECQASLNQVTSNTDRDGNTITVKHTYPSDDTDYASQTKQQGGEIQFFQPQITMKYQGIKSTLLPWMIARGIVGCVNEAPWNGGEKQTWMCTACTWKPHNIGAVPIKYLFTFEFQHNPDSWSPTVVFIDDRTGKPPISLLAGVGYKTVPKHIEVDFEAIIGVVVQGG